MQTIKKPSFSNTDTENLEKVIAISRILSPTPVDNNYWRELIHKSMTDEKMTIMEAFELGRFAERMVTYAYEHKETESFSACIGYKQDLQGKFHYLTELAKYV